MIKISMGRVKITKVGADLSCTSIRKELLSKLIDTMCGKHKPEEGGD